MWGVKRIAILPCLIISFILLYRPFKVVDQRGFREYTRALEPRYVIPSRETLSKVELPKLYNTIKDEIKEKISGARRVAITADSWTSRATQSYLTITCHFIDDEWCLKNFILQTRLMDRPHTGEYIATILEEACAEWGLEKKDPAFVSDNAANMLAAAKETYFDPHLGCFAHTLNLGIRKAMKIPSVSRLIGRIKRTVNFFHRSATATTLLSCKQQALELPKHKLKMDVETRWNSTYDMFVRYLEQQPAIHAVLLSKEIRKSVRDVDTVSESDVAEIECLVDILKPVKAVTSAICDESSPTISLIGPLMTKLLRCMEISENDDRLVKDVKNCITSDLQNRYSDPHIQDILTLSTFLDPRFKTLHYCSDDEKENIYETAAVDAGALYSRRTAVETPTSSQGEVLPPLPSLPGMEPEVINQEAECSPARKKHKSTVGDCLESLFEDVIVTEVTQTQLKSPQELAKEDINV